MFNNITKELKIAVQDDKLRHNVQFRWAYNILGIVSTFMTIVNIIDERYQLMSATLLFAIGCFINRILINGNQKCKNLSYNIFTVESLILCTYFVVSGNPEGFSVIWLLLIPGSGLLLYGRKSGTIISIILFIIVIFFFWTPIGVSFLKYDYTYSFKLRFPFAFVAFYLTSLLLETVRELTNYHLKNTQNLYHNLYLHDALTGLYNRYRFNSEIDNANKKTNSNYISLMILDLDHFKRINDTYGHPKGDEVLKKVADTLYDVIGDEGELYRWGGEEFAVLLYNKPNPYSIAEEIRKTIASTKLESNQGDITFTISIGIAVSDHQNIDCNTLIDYADKCLYQAKNEGRNKCVLEYIKEAS